MNPNVDDGLPLIIMYPHWLINCSTCTTPVHDVNSSNNNRGKLRGRVVDWGERVYEDSLYFLLKFSVNLRLLLRNKVH